MSRFVDRQSEIQELNYLFQARARLGQFVIVYGRRRVGKTTLLLHWAQDIQQPHLYWVARRETAEACRQSLARALWKYAYNDPQAEPPRFGSWETLFEQMQRMIKDRPPIIIFDEFPYAVESDSSLPSHLQAAWDHLFKDLPVVLILAGSHIGMMVDLMNYQAPLYGRFTGQLPLGPLPFGVLSEFFPRYEAAERVSTYACLGGIPAYLECFDPGQSLSTNIRQHLFQSSGMFRSEPAFLISDQVRETRIYESILRAIANGAHTPAEIAQSIGVQSPNLPPYLKRLIDLHLIERRVPATIHQEQREITTRSRYYVSDPYLRFYFRFVEPNLDMVELGQAETLWRKIGEQFRSFVGVTTFEELCREWVIRQARQRKLPFQLERVGSHWAGDVQVDVVAINWQERAILLGECKWGVEAVGRSVIRDLVDKASKAVPGKGWQVHFACFARAGFTDAAREEAQRIGAMLVDLETLDKDLRV